MSTQREILGDILFAFGEYYDKRLTANQLGMYVEDLTDLSADELRAACKLYRQDAKNERFPLPAKLIALARPKDSPEDAGREIAAGIIDAVFKAGWNNPEKARAIMGEVGWAIISRMGGWQNFCQELTNENMPTMRAQIRDLAMTTVRRASMAERFQHQQIESKTGGEVNNLIADLVRKTGVPDEQV